HPGDPPYRLLAQARVSERTEDGVSACGAGPGAVGPAGVVHVLPVRHGGQPVPAHNLVVDPAEQLVLAVEAAVRPVAPVLRAVPLVRAHLDNPYPDPRAHPVPAAALRARQ